MNRPTQLPHGARGEALCRHVQAGRCTWWCSYRRGTWFFGCAFATLIGIGLILWLGGDPAARQQVVEAAAAVGLLLAVGVPVAMGLNRRNPEA